MMLILLSLSLLSGRSILIQKLMTAEDFLTYLIHKECFYRIHRSLQFTSRFCETQVLIHRGKRTSQLLCIVYDMLTIGLVFLETNTLYFNSYHFRHQFAHNKNNIGFSFNNSVREHLVASHATLANVGYV